MPFSHFSAYFDDINEVEGMEGEGRGMGRGHFQLKLRLERFHEFQGINCLVCERAVIAEQS